MSDLAWEAINDQLFVKLTGTLLSRYGFIDLDYQGTGPDGGIDLFATELVTFTVQGSVPFRWAIQCKYSSEPSDKSVKASEISDISGILRSQRYAVQKPQGYMLVTNRRITQTVVERLRGINDTTEFRTARIDGDRVESMLSEKPEISDAFFGSQILGTPAITARNPKGRYLESRPKTSVTFRLIEGMQATGPCASWVCRELLIDPHSIQTTLNRSQFEALGAIPYPRSEEPEWSKHKGQPAAILELEIDGIKHFCRVTMVENDQECVLGSEILQKYITVIHPDGTCHLHSAGPQTA
ncbi:hypothetical protein N836_31490 [Leptolyngbya sp. Heron Island J]|uniref:restriction endonuclease n=1 Tax=Leptolyngbya sp. Heron Island J TaxID=1385935 RepID=UPI0003B9F9E7|nr:restriction endonuclease [Leptolyngbya sp. Heron Island J]ESA38466.1 hypothetical protein N836_31490 [Leptolyngbya sp. Heron Island J]